MVDWNSPTEIQYESTVFFKLVHSLTGVFVWDFITSLDFEWSFITGRKKFRWPLAFYFLSRYVLLATVIGMLVALDTTREINCQALYSFIGFAAQASVGLPSLILAIRTMLLWSMNQWIVVPLIVIILGQWSLIAQGAAVKAMHVPGTGCVLSSTRLTATAASFIYAASFDLIVLILSTWKLVCSRTRFPRFSHLMLRDGLMYYLLVLLASVPAAVFVCLNLNSVMNVMFNVPAAVFSTVACGHAVRRLSNFSGPERKNYSPSPSHTVGLISSSRETPGSQSRGRSLFVDKTRGDETQHQLDTFLIMEDGNSIRLPHRNP